MSGAVPHFVRVVEAPGQPARTYPALSKAAAIATARRIFDTGLKDATISVYEGKPNDGIERDPVKVWP